MKNEYYPLVEGNKEINTAVLNNLAYICSETLAQSFIIVENIGDPGKDLIELADTLAVNILVQRVSARNKG